MNWNQWKEFEGKTIEEAIEKALTVLNRRREEVRVDVISDPSTSKVRFFGFSLKNAKIRVYYRDENAPTSQPSFQEKKTQEIEEKADYAPRKKEYTQPRQESEKSYSIIAVKGRDFINQVLTDLELGSQVERIREKGDVIYYFLGADEPKLIIGKNGMLIESLQALTYMVANKNEKKWKKILIDVDHYRERRERKIRSYIYKIAKKVQRSGRPFITPPYSSYDRRIIHMVVQEMRGVVSESEGHGLYKRVWIKPE